MQRNSQALARTCKKPFESDANVEHARLRERFFLSAAFFFLTLGPHCFIESPVTGTAAVKS